MRKFLSESWTEINPQFPLPSLPRSSSASSVYLPPHLASCFIFINCISLNLVFYSPSVFCFFKLLFLSLNPFALFTLRGLLLPHLFLCEREYLFQRQGRIEMQLVDRKETSPPSSPPASPSIPLLLFTGIHAVWIDVNEGHLVAD